MEKKWLEFKNTLKDVSISETFYSNVEKSMIGLSGFQDMKDGLQNIFNYFKKFLEKEESTNVLLIGKVQAGKTNGFLSLVANSFDHSTNITIILTGIDKTLKYQTANERIIPLFDGNSIVKVLTFNSINDMKESYKIVNNSLNEGQKIIFVTLKNIAWLKEMNKQIKLWDKSKIINPLVIDDEGDQASQNVDKDKDDGEASPIFKEITNTLKSFEKIIFISVTATPYAHILIDSQNEIKPDYSISLFPGEGYLGLEEIVNKKKMINLISGEDKETIRQSSVPLSLKNALIDFLFSGALLYENKDNVKMLINIDRETKEHENISDILQTFIQNEFENFIFSKDQIEHSISNFKRKFEIAFNNDFNIPELETKETIREIIRKFKQSHNIKIVNQKSNGNLSSIVNAKYEIYIGSDLLQRGVTIKNLVVSYIARRAKGTSNADTILQMARWFGYRNNIKEFMSIYLLDKLYSDFIWIEGLDSSVRDTLYEYQLKNKSIKNLERKIKITQTANEKLSKMNLRAVRTSVAKQEITDSNKRQTNLIHIYDNVSSHSINEQIYLNSIYMLLKNNWELKKQTSNEINTKFRKYPIVIFDSIDKLGSSNFEIIKIMLLKYQGYTQNQINLLEQDLQNGKKKFVLAWMTKSIKDNNINEIFDAIGKRYYDFVGKRISTIPMGNSSNTYISEKHWSKFEESYFFFNIYKIKLDDPNRKNDNTIIYKSITSSDYNSENEYFIISAIEN